MKYFIYHIEGVKIGCSKNPIRRVKSQGYDSFVILEEHLDPIIAGEREIELQKEFGYKADNFNYSLVCSKSDEAREKMSKLKIGTKQTDETKVKRSVALKGNTNALGNILSDEFRSKTSERMKGKKHALGYKHTDESKSKASERMKGKKHSLGYKHTDDAKQKISKAQIKPYCTYDGNIYTCIEIAKLLNYSRKYIVKLKYVYGNSNKKGITFL